MNKLSYYLYTTIAGLGGGALMVFGIGMPWPTCFMALIFSSMATGYAILIFINGNPRE